MKQLLLALFVVGIVLAPSAQAGDFYLGASVGSSDLELDSATRVNFDATGYKAFVGYKFMRFLGVELGYTDFGDPSETVNGTQFDAEVQMLALWAIGILPVSPRLDLYGRLGWSAWDSKVTIDRGSPADNDGNDLGFGFGISYNITRKFGLQLEWENYQLEGSNEATFTSVGVRYTF